MYQLKRCWSALPSSFWFVPTLIVAGSITLAMALVEAHSTASAQWLARWPRLFGASAEGVRGMLSTIAGSMMTVVGVTFSMMALDDFSAGPLSLIKTAMLVGAAGQPDAELCPTVSSSFPPGAGCLQGLTPIPVVTLPSAE